MILYHASLNLDIIEEFMPRIPKEEHRHILEDANIKRVCASSTISGCLTATPWGGSCFTDNINLVSSNRLIRIYEFETNDINNKHIIYPDELYKTDKVRDAQITKEHWILDTIRPKKNYLIKVTNYNDQYVEDDISFSNKEILEKNELSNEQENELIDGVFTVVELYNYKIVEEEYRSKIMKINFQIEIVDGYSPDIGINEILDLFPYSSRSYMSIVHINDKSYLEGTIDTRTREIDIRDLKEIINHCVDGIRIC